MVTTKTKKQSPHPRLYCNLLQVLRSMRWFQLCSALLSFAQPTYLHFIRLFFHSASKQHTDGTVGGPKDALYYIPISFNENELARMVKNLRPSHKTFSGNAGFKMRGTTFGPLGRVSLAGNQKRGHWMPLVYVLN